MNNRYPFTAPNWSDYGLSDINSLSSSKVASESTKYKETDIDDKKRSRLERNRESARQCRKRKREKMSDLRQKLALLETDNLKLRLQLQVGPEARKQQEEKSREMTKRLASMIGEGSSDNDIRGAIEEMQEKFADYGRDRTSAISFHLSQLRRCLKPTQTTRTILWLMSCAPNYYNDDGSSKIIIENDDTTNLWMDLHNAINPSQDQCKQLVYLAKLPLTVLEGSTLKQSVSTSTLASENSSNANVDFLSSANYSPEIELNSETILARLDDLISERNETLDQEMSEIQNVLSTSQIAKFIVWINKNPAVIQMLEALWPHWSQAAVESE